MKINLLCLALFFSAHAFGVPIIGIIPNIGPVSSSSSLYEWSANVISSLQSEQAIGVGATAFSPVVGGTVDPHWIISTEWSGFNSWLGAETSSNHFEGEHGNTLYFSLIVRDNEGAESIRLSDLFVEESYFGQNLGVSPIGGPYRATAVGVLSDGTLLNAGQHPDTLVSSLYYVGVGVNWQPDPTIASLTTQINSSVSTILALGDRSNTVCYHIGDSASQCATVYVENSTVPEPESLGLTAVGLLMVTIASRWHCGRSKLRFR